MPPITSMFLGDSSSHGTLGESRLGVTPRENINAAQDVFYIPATKDYTKGGASFAGILSDDPLIRAAHGMPGGVTLDYLLAFGGAQAALFGLGANDSAVGLADRIKAVATKCISLSRHFAFVGIVDIDGKAGYDYGIANGLIDPNVDYYELMASIASVAYNAELLRQVCLKECYPFVDVRNLVPLPHGNVTGDVVHPTQQYSTAIFNRVGRSIAGLP